MTEKWYKVTAVIRTTEIPFLFGEPEYDTIIDEVYYGGFIKDEILDGAEAFFWKKYGYNTDVILVGIELI
ncbi:hypothetical protein CUN38_05120 [Enterococcus faecium]|uniref:hypothetical protein n=1 Tax=Enterococcus faecium TaxID=1352 RepID=UPI000CF15498|nr:hypothetical protein [Enterococcus faecium]PQC93522.1 hypothetical protein CUN38_05120 [Enterococcus faecium]